MIEHTKMRVIVTSAEIPHLKEMRTEEYLKNIYWMKENLVNENIIFIETILNEGSFIEKYYPVFYSEIHIPHFKNKGANLGLALREYFKKNIVDDDEIVVQTTGRYHFRSMDFFKAIESNKDFDFYGAERPNENQYFTGCFALKSKYFKNWVFSTDWHELNNKSINFEKSLYDFVRYNKLKCFHVEKIDMDCNIFDEGTPERHIM